MKHTGAKASPDAVKLLHTLRGKVGGLVVCDPKEPCPYKNGKLCGYHTQLAAFKDTDGNSGEVVEGALEGPEQISNLIGRLTRRRSTSSWNARGQGRWTNRGDIIPINRDPPSREAALAISGALKTKQMDAMELCAVFGVDDVTEISASDADKALALVFAYGTGNYGRVLAEVTGVPQ